jgi:hypothetical protein
MRFFILFLFFLLPSRTIAGIENLEAKEMKVLEDANPETMEAQAFTEYKTKKNFDTKKYGEKVQRAYNNLVKFGTYRMARTGYTGYKKYEKEWNILYSKHFLMLEIGIDNVEDHDPAIKWLNDFYLKLVEILGISSVKFMHLDDIDVLNRAIPVVFTPK